MPMGIVPLAAPDANGYDKRFVAPKKTITCYICGREYGSASYNIHEGKCKEKFMADQQKLPTSQRRKLPSKPLNLAEAQARASINDDGRIILTDKDREEMNKETLNTFLEQGREPCQHCGRKFLADRLQVHLKSCGPGSYFAKKTQRKNAEGIVMDLAEQVDKKVRITFKTDKKGGGDEEKKTSTTLTGFTMRVREIPKGPVPKPTTTTELIVKPSPAANDSSSNNNNIAFTQKFCCECGGKFECGDKYCSGCGCKRS